MTDAGWTDERIELAKKLRRKGKSFGDIAALLGGGLSRNAVIGKMRRIGFDEGNKLKGTDARPRHRAKPRAKTQTFDATSIHHNIEARRHSSPHNLIAHAKGRESAPGLKAQPEPKERAGAPSPLLIPLLELKHRHCRWPIGDVRGSGGIAFCGHDRKGERSYCEFHCGIAYSAAPLRQLRAA